MRSSVYETVERPSVRPSVCPVDRQLQQRPLAGLLLSALLTGDIGRALTPRTSCGRRRSSAARRSAANAGSDTSAAAARG